MKTFKYVILVIKLRVLRNTMIDYRGILKNKFSILHQKPCFKIISDEIEQFEIWIHAAGPRSSILTILFHQKRSSGL